MLSFLPVFLIILVFVCIFGYMTYRDAARKRAQEKRRNQYHDRV
jgi:cbb3-type cytochrome oxidase subunit 3